MKVTVTTPVANIKMCYVPGTEYEIDDAEAQLLIDAGQAVAVDPTYKPKPQPQKLDKPASVPVETVDTLKPVAPVSPVAPAVTAGTTNAALTTQTAVDAAKKGGK